MIHDSNSPALTAAAVEAGAIAYRVGIVPDDPRVLADVIEDQLVRAGQTREAFLEEQGKTAEEWDAELKQGAEQAVKAQLVLDAMCHNAPDGIVCLTGVSSGGRPFDVDAGLLNRNMVLQNDVVFGSVNANRRHYEAGAEALARADRQWLAKLITRRVGPDWLTGGDFGLEASVVAMVVATGAGVALLVVAARRGAIVPPLWVRRREAGQA